MSSITTIEIDGKNYNAVQAGAISQKKLMTIVGARISLNSAATQTEVIDSNMIYGLLLSLPESQVDEVSKIVMHQVFVSGTTTAVVIEDFQGRIHSYFQLLAALIVMNLKDFFTWLDAENAKQRLANKGERA